MPHNVQPPVSTLLVALPAVLGRVVEADSLNVGASLALVKIFPVRQSSWQRLVTYLPIT